MSYRIEQKEGPHKEAIDQAVREYKDGHASAKATWGRLAALYQLANHSKAPDFAEHEARGYDHLNYMIRIWFPRYANMWYSGPDHKCHAEAARLNRAGCGKFSVCYEY